MKLSALLPVLGFVVVGLSAMPNQASAAINCTTCRTIYNNCMAANPPPYDDPAACVDEMIAFNPQCGSCPLLPSQIGAAPVRRHKDAARSIDKVTLQIAHREIASLTVR